MDTSNLKRLAQLKCLLSVEGIGPTKVYQLVSKFSSLDNLFNSDLKTLQFIGRLSERLADRFVSTKTNLDEFFDQLNSEIETLTRMNSKMFSFYDEDYPKLLKSIYSPPVILYQKGDLADSDENSVAVVGTRMPTYYGKEQTVKIVKELAQQNLTVVSGLARGIDSIAHSTAIKNGGRTIAVVGSGLDVIYPPENKKLFNSIAENGAVLSEYPLGTKPDAQNFPKRNRIISGLSRGTLVVETKINGGAMHTANYAFDQNREVFAIPGNLGVKQSEGTNFLISNNKAKLICDANDILEELNLIIKPVVDFNIPKTPKDLSLFEQKVFDSLEKKPLHIDKLAGLTKLDTSDCLVNLLTLEFKGLVKQHPGKLFSRVY